jgi:hypothetical protein
MMKTPIASSGSIQNALLRWRIVNPAEARCVRGQRDKFAARSASRGKKRLKTHNSCG